MKLSQDELDLLLARYFSCDITDSEKQILDTWRSSSPENETLFKEYTKSWESITVLNEMEQFDSFDALNKINAKLDLSVKPRWWTLFQRVAAILLLPLLGYTLYISFGPDSNSGREIVQKISSRPGMVMQLVLDDGTKVWLNSGSELELPTHFTGKSREVKLKGEAFFEVTKDKNHPFRVITANNLNIEVLGTSFNVSSYDDDDQTEVVLVEGQVALSSGVDRRNKDFGSIYPGQLAVYDKQKQSVAKNQVDVEKYLGWRTGYLAFHDNSMEEVIKRLSRWFNVEIILDSDELKGYKFKATFKEESLSQVLNLLKLSSPIDYKISQRKLLPDGEFSKQKIHIMIKPN